MLDRVLFTLLGIIGVTAFIVVWGFMEVQREGYVYYKFQGDNENWKIEAEFILHNDPKIEAKDFIHIEPKDSNFTANHPTILRFSNPTQELFSKKVTEVEAIVLESGSVKRTVSFNSNTTFFLEIVHEGISETIPLSYETAGTHKRPNTRNDINTSIYDRIEDTRE